MFLQGRSVLLALDTGVTACGTRPRTGPGSGSSPQSSEGTDEPVPEIPAVGHNFDVHEIAKQLRLVLREFCSFDMQFAIFPHVQDDGGDPAVSFRPPAGFKLGANVVYDPSRADFIIASHDQQPQVAQLREKGFQVLPFTWLAQAVTSSAPALPPTEVRAAVAFY